MNVLRSVSPTVLTNASMEDVSLPIPASVNQDGEVQTVPAHVTAVTGGPTVTTGVSARMELYVIPSLGRASAHQATRAGGVRSSVALERTAMGAS